MEEGKKKRWRPSLAQYRELEAKLEEQIDGTSLIVADCNGWRAKYRDLIKSISDGKDKKVLREHIEALESENTSLKRSNELMEKELNKIRNEERSYEKECDELKERIFLLENRGFWARLFNKKV